MILVPFEYLKKSLYLSPLAPSEVAEKLTYAGLETGLVEKNQHFYLEVNPLPNRTDLLCWKGIVHEIKILLNCAEKPLKLVSPSFSKKKLFSVSIATKNCLTFGLGLVRNIKVKTSPAWLREWLVVNKIPAVNNLVDSINLTRLETGQSLRVYDYDVLAKKKQIVVEQSGQRETVQLLSGSELTLNSEDIVVRVDHKIISLGGIAETKKASWTEQTKNILVEWSSFNPLQLKKTAQRLNILSSSPPPFLEETFSHFITLLSETYTSNLDSEVIFTYQKPLPKPHLVKVGQTFLEKKTGQPLPVQQIEKIWKQLNFPYTKKGKVYLIEVPFYRSDLSEPEDLLEELLRIYGYDNIK